MGLISSQLVPSKRQMRLCWARTLWLVVVLVASSYTWVAQAEVDKDWLDIKHSVRGIGQDSALVPLRMISQN